MARVEFTGAKVMNDDGLWLCLKLAPESVQEARRFVFGRPAKRYDAEIKEHREKRSLDANGYCWKLLDEIAAATGEDKYTLYLQKVKEVGPFKDFPLDQDTVSTFRTAWGRQGVGWPTEQVDYDKDGERVVIRAYYGSSTYNTRQMSRLIDSIVEDCSDLGIETLPPDKIALLKEDWSGGR